MYDVDLVVESSLDEKILDLGCLRVLVDLPLGQTTDIVREEWAYFQATEPDDNVEFIDFLIEGHPEIFAFGEVRETIVVATW